MAMPQGNMCLFLISILLQTMILVVLFKPDSNDTSTPTTPPFVNDIIQLQHSLNQIAQTLQVTQEQNKIEIQEVKEELQELINQNSYGDNQTSSSPGDLQAIQDMLNSLALKLESSGGNAGFDDGTGGVEKEKPDIQQTYPGLMKYRYTLANTKFKLGEPFPEYSMVLLEENGKKYWGWSGFMAGWVYGTETGESMVREVFKKVLGSQESPNLVLDVGSNTGLFSMMAALYNTKRIYAFDPQPTCCMRVATSAQMNGFNDRIAAINAFVAEDETHTAPIPNNTCDGSFKVTEGTANSAQVDIHSVNLDNYFINDTFIDLMKVDVEGAELFVLRGAKELFKQRRVRSIVIELTPGWWEPNFKTPYDTGAAFIKELLVDTGYKAWVMSNTDGSRFLPTWDALDKEMRPPGGYHNQKNYLFSLDDVFPTTA